MTRDYGSCAPPSPFQPFIGDWHGAAKDFDAEGRFVRSVMAVFDIFWVERGALFRIVERGRNELQIDYAISAKRARGRYGDNRGEMVALTPSNFTVTAHLADGGRAYFNHYFLTPSTRRILGHSVSASGESLGYTVYDLVDVAQRS